MGGEAGSASCATLARLTRRLSRRLLRTLSLFDHISVRIEVIEIAIVLDLDHGRIDSILDPN